MSKKKKFSRQPKYKSLKENTLIGSQQAVEGRAAIPQEEVLSSVTGGLIHPALLMSAFLFYDEIILKANLGGQWWPNLLFILLFSAFYGILLWLLTSFSRNPETNRRFRVTAVFLTAVMFLVNFFIFRQFKVLYDVKTITAGASDMLGGFLKETFALVFSPDGIVHLLLYLVPVALYFIYREKLDSGARMDRKTLLKAGISAAAALTAAFGGIAVYPSYKTSYFDQYSFQNNVPSFGLLNSVRMDILHSVIRREATFHDVEETSGSGTVKIRQPSTMIIDFNVLESTANSLESSLDQYVKSREPSYKNDYTGLFKGKNLILITAEAFSGVIIDEQLTPTLYRLANNGIRFTDFTQPSSAGTTGGEYEILFGMLPTNGGSSLKNTQDYHNLLTMGSQLDRLGYEGWAFHNNDYTFYDRHLTHVNLGYSHGYMGEGNGMEEYVTHQWPQSDLEMFQGTMPMYLEQDKPFNVYYMTVSGHNGYDRDANAMSKKNWDKVKDLPYSDPVKGYYAANLELENAMAYMVQQLEEKGIADDTVIVICGDHFPYGLDYGAGLGQMPYLSELYGHNVTDFLDRDQNRLIIWSGSLEKQEPITVDTPVSSLDILPTLSNLFGTDWDSRLLPGRDVFAEGTLPLVFDMYYDWKTDKGSYNAQTGEFTPSGEAVDAEYIERIKSIVANKITYCEGYNDTDYFAHVLYNLVDDTGK
ncbi:MAG: hypothetical protein E7185_06320 [Erysipelotrichaceae bacterium]|nr:hypothetical protein [Erysipelotrichaceae bacterium]